jgi:phosphoesterase RecJ-like protein
VCATSAADARDRALRRLVAAGRLLLVGHARPDGDTLGCLAGLGASAQRAGKTVRLLVPDRIPRLYEFLFRGEPGTGEQGEASSGPPPNSLKVEPVERFAELADAADLIVILDTCAFAQLDKLEPHLRARRGKIVVIDHHVTVDEVGEVQWIDTTAAATGVMVLEALETLGWPVAPAAEALAMAITTDTGWLRFSNTDGRCLRAFGRLLEAGVRPDELYARLYQADRPARMRLMERVLRSLEFHCGDRLAVMTLSQTDFAQTGALPEETENLVSEAFRVGSVEVSVLLTEMPDCIRISFRSRRCVDVAAVAQGFGGGGHARAAGARVGGRLDEQKARVVETLAAEIRKLNLTGKERDCRG